MKQVIAVVLVGMSMVGMFLAGCSSPAPEVEAAKTEAAAPGISAIGAEGVGRMISDAKGKVVVLNFWATWCPPCVAEMPELVKFYNETKREDVEFISLCANDPAEMRTTVAAFLKDRNLTFPVFVLNDPGGVELLAKSTKAALTGGLPATLIYGRDGALVHTWERDTTQAELNEAIKPLL